jgi:hypothetical protein
MCEYSGRLVAWIDHELLDEEATNVGWHVGRCAECRQAVNRYEEVSGAFLACYQATIAVPPHRSAFTWTTGGVAAAAAILAAILFAQPRAEYLSVYVPPPTHAPAIAFDTTPVRTVAAPLRPSPARTRMPVPSPWIAVEPTVIVALPADALFPPGAVPQGFSFIADVRP